MGNRHFYWIKIQESFFKQKELNKLRRMPKGDTYVIIYQKLLLRAILETDKLYYDGVEEDLATELAYEIDEDVDAVKVTVDFLMKNKLMFQTGDNEYILIAASELAGKESDSASRMRRHRQAALRAGESDPLLNERHNVQKCDVEKEIESESETESEKESESYSYLYQKSESEFDDDDCAELKKANDEDNGDICSSKFGIPLDIAVEFINERLDDVIKVNRKLVADYVKQGFDIYAIFWYAKYAIINSDENPMGYFVTLMKDKSESNDKVAIDIINHIAQDDESRVSKLEKVMAFNRAINAKIEKANKKGCA